MLNKQQEESFMIAFGRAYDGLLEGVNDHERLGKDLGMDEIDLIEAVVSIEDEFDVTLDSIFEARTIADLKKLTLNAIYENE